MADLTSSLEADLFAALHASDSFSTTLPEPEHHRQPELQTQPQPDPEKPTATQIQPEPPQPSHETISAQDQQTARDLATQSTHDLLASLNAMTQPPPVTYTATAQDTAPQRSPKRERSPDMFDLGNSEKRLKTEGVEHGGQIQGEAQHELAGFDMAAMLQNALGSFDQQFDMSEAPLTTDNTNEIRQQASATATPVPEKVEHKIMKTSSNSTYVMRSMSLPVLGNVAVQLLVRLSQQSRSDTDLLLSDSESEFRQAYTILRDMFGLARKVFSDSPLLFPDELDISDSEDRETIRMSNLAATALSIFGVNDVTLNDIHESFFSIFVQEEGEYKEPLTTLLISLKTRLFINSLGEQTDSQHVSELLDRLFAVDMEQTLKLRSGDMALNSDEEMLVGQIAERREYLARSAADEEFRKSLANQFSPEEFADNLSTFLQSHLGIVIEYAEKYGVNIPLGEESGGTDLVDHNHQDEHADLAALIQSEIIQHDISSKDIHSDDLMGDTMGDTSMSLSDSLDLGKLLEQSLSNHNPELKDGLPEQHDSNETSDLFGSKDLAALISEKLNDTLNDLPNGLPNLASTHTHNGHETNNGLHPEYVAQMEQSHSSSYASYNQTPVSAVPTGVAGSTLPPHQSSPTSVLYERARQAAVAKSSNTARREGLHSTRRPWTPDEEKALMAGLDTVKGPHWSQILSLFGANGTISDILKDRTQVQLKDKARNLKLFFLKTNSEMPFYLQSVTGELKTRAPSQAARKEAEEKARLNSEEEQARLQTIMTLAGGLQNNHHPIASSPLAGASPARAGSIAPGVRNGTAVTSQGSNNSVPALAPMPISPMIKNEPADHHHVSHSSSLPHIQPAPAQPLQPALKPHPPQIHHSQQQQHQQHQQLHQPQSQPQHGQQQHHQQQHQQQQPQQHHQVQQSQPSHTHTPQQILPAPPPHHHTQTQQSPPAPVSHQHQNFTLPPMPPNHHSTPDHQDAKLFEALQTAIAATPSTVSEPQAT